MTTLPTPEEMGQNIVPIEFAKGMHGYSAQTWCEVAIRARDEAIAAWIEEFKNFTIRQSSSVSDERMIFAMKGLETACDTILIVLRPKQGPDKNGKGEPPCDDSPSAPLV